MSEDQASRRGSTFCCQQWKLPAGDVGHMGPCPVPCHCGPSLAVSCTALAHKPGSYWGNLRSHVQTHSWGHSLGRSRCFQQRACQQANQPESDRRSGRLRSSGSGSGIAGDADMGAV